MGERINRLVNATKTAFEEAWNNIDNMEDYRLKTEGVIYQEMSCKWKGFGPYGGYEEDTSDPFVSLENMFVGIKIITGIPFDIWNNYHSNLKE